jgi:hypothetical protein
MPDPFKSARRASGITVVLRPENVMTAWGTISRAEAERLFFDHAETIASQMLAVGIEAAATLIRQERGEL